jgi:hypothetical protein
VRHADILTPGSISGRKAGPADVASYQEAIAPLLTARQRGEEQHKLECDWHLCFVLISRGRYLSARNSGSASSVEACHPHAFLLYTFFREIDVKLSAMKNRRLTSIRKPVRRKGAQRYILLTLLSFAASVSVTRLFLQLTGYPQIGSGDLHIAHLLWGGLLLFIATLIPLLYANRWGLTVTAILSGVGVGLFIDEVGKFITRNNNYFFPAAAPIIYAFFLITVLLYTRIRRNHAEDPRTEMYIIIDELEEVLDRDLSPDERSDIIDRLHRISLQSTEKNLSRLGKSLEEFIESRKLDVVPHVPDLWERLQVRFNILAQKIITRSRMRAFLVGGLTILGAWTLSDPISIIARINSPFELQAYLAQLFTAQNVRGNISLGSFEIRLGLEIAVGVILITAAVLIAMRKDLGGIALGHVGLLILITIVNLLVFYFDQFSTIINALIQLVFLLALFYYRNHFFTSKI